jgi:hypothetical protein
MSLGKFGDACNQMRHAIAVAQAIDREFPISDTLTHETRGTTFRPTLIRSMMIALGQAIIRVIY